MIIKETNTLLQLEGIGKMDFSHVTAMQNWLVAGVEPLLNTVYQEPTYFLSVNVCFPAYNSY